MKSRLDFHVRTLRLFVVGLALGTGLPALAQRTTIGPFVDFTGRAALGASLPYQTKTQIDVLMYFYAYVVTSGNPPVTQVFTGFAPGQPITTCTPSGGFAGPGQPFCGSWRFLDSIDISNLSNSAVPVKGLSYFTYDTSDNTGLVQITTLYGLDLDPSGTRLSVGGIEPNGPPLEFSNERISEVWGDPHEYLPGFASRVSLSQLGTVLGSDFDVSVIHGTPSSTVQVFQTDLLVSAIAAVPEPDTYALFACGLVGVGVARLRRAMPNGGHS